MSPRGDKFSEAAAWEAIEGYLEQADSALHSGGASRVTLARRELARAQELVKAMQKQLATGLHQNPALIVWPNPGTARRGVSIMSRRVIEIAYKHVDDGKDYTHPFQPGACILTDDKNPDRVLIFQKDGRPLWKDF